MTRSTDFMLLGLDPDGLPPLTDGDRAYAYVDVLQPGGNARFHVGGTPDTMRLLSHLKGTPLATIGKGKHWFHHRYLIVDADEPIPDDAEPLAILRFTPMPDGMTAVEGGLFPYLDEREERAVHTILALLAGERGA